MDIAISNVVLTLLFLMAAPFIILGIAVLFFGVATIVAMPFNLFCKYMDKWLS